MNTFSVRQAQQSDKAQMADIIVHAFKQDFCTASSDMKKVSVALSRILVAERFFVAEVSGSIAGIAACSDINGRAMSIHTPNMLRHLGIVRQLICSTKQDNHSTFEQKLRTGYFEFVAVCDAFRRQGIASGILKYIIQNTAYTEYLLDVLESSPTAIACYKKLGFLQIDSEIDKRLSPPQMRIFMGAIKNI